MVSVSTKLPQVSVTHLLAHKTQASGGVGGAASIDALLPALCRKQGRRRIEQELLARGSGLGTQAILWFNSKKGRPAKAVPFFVP